VWPASPAISTTPVAEFSPPPDARWQTLIPADGDETIAHHDLAPWNLIINDQQWAVIDWDMAAPGTRVSYVICQGVRRRYVLL
jgi:aminoglycoside phosphotransferase (APT) family kinase protein